MPAFDEDDRVNHAEFGDRLFLPWAGPPPYLLVPLSASGGPLGHAKRVESVRVKFDTGSADSYLTLRTASKLGLKLTWDTADEFRLAKTAAGSYLITLERIVDIVFDQKNRRLSAVIKAGIPIADEHDAYNHWLLWVKALEWLRETKHSRTINAERHVEQNLLGLDDVLGHFLVCIADEGLYLFPKKKPGRSIPRVAMTPTETLTEPTMLRRLWRRVSSVLHRVWHRDQRARYVPAASGVYA